jgi:xanthine dehydrogenase accessory factor
LSRHTLPPTKNWKETADIIDRVAQLDSLSRSAAIATVVRIAGSAYRRPGAKLLVEDDGRTVGGVSGGCLEADVCGVALAVMRTRIPRVLHYDTGADDQTVWGLGLGCYGSVDVFVQPVDAPGVRDTLHAVRGLLNRDDPFAICTVIDGPLDVGRSVIVGTEGVLAVSTGPQGLDDDLTRFAGDCLTLRTSRLHSVDSRLVFAEVLVPPPRLVVCGAGDDSRPLVAYASDSGYAVTVVDHRVAFLSSDRFPAARRLVALRPEDDPATLGIGSDTAVVIQTHSFAHDRAWLSYVLRTDASYIGLLGPRARTDRILHQIRAQDSRRVFGPVGLDLGAEGPEQIAISIVAELLAVRADHKPKHLRDRRMAIHAY